MPYRSSVDVVLLVGLACLPAAITRAGEGQIEINQTCAIQTGCFSGDTPGFPVVITQSGSYRLTDDLLVRSASAQNTTGIRIDADDVTLDMAGFSIRCEVPNIPVPFPCSSLTGTGYGIWLLEAENVRIADGTIRNFGQHGVYASQTGSDYQLHGLRILGNGVNGIESRAIGSIVDCTVMNNGGVGIHVDAFGALILDTVTSNNAGGGITDGNGTVAAGTSFFHDGATGITTADLVGCVTVGSSNLCP